MRLLCPFLGLLLLASCAEAPMGPGEAGDGPLDAPRPDVTLAADDPVFVGAGDIHDTCDDADAEITASLLDGIPGTVFTTGDHVPNGTSDEFTNCYDSRWGRHKARTRPTAGDDEYSQAGAAPYFDYFGADAGGPEGYYSYDLGDWHIISLNSNIASDSSSEQVAWLKADLAANPSACTLALWHHPRFSAGRATLDRKMRFIWKTLDEAGADVVLNAHHHHYERFAPQDADGNANPEGIRAFIVGTGGKPLGSATNVKPNSEKIIATAFGVLELTLHPTGYSWDFVAEPGSTETDTGTASCVEIPGGSSVPPTADAGGPYSGDEGSAIVFDGSGSADPEGQALAYAWDFGDGSTGTGVTPSHAYADDGTYTVGLIVTDPDGLSDTTGTSATVANVAPTATFSAPASAPPDTDFVLSMTNASDASSVDQAAGFTYAFDCGSGTYGDWGASADTTCPGVSTLGPVTVKGKVRDIDLGEREYTATVEIADGPANQAPTAATTGPYSGKEGTAINLSGSGSSDPEGQTLAYAWDFGDGTAGNGATVSHAYDDNGSYAVTLVVTDPGGLSDTTETTATISNVKPSATFNHPSSVPVNTGFTLSLTDPSDPSAADEAAGFKYRFDCGSGWSKLSNNPSRDCPGHSTTGTISVRGRIRDKDGAIRTYRRSVEITAS